MKHLMSLAVSTLALMLIPVGAQAQAVGPQEIQQTWVGKPLSGSTGSGRGFTMTLAADGVISISGEAANDTGTWRLSEAGYCTTWKTIRAGQERCFMVRRLGNGDMTVFNPDGSVSGHIPQIK